MTDRDPLGRTRLCECGHVEDNHYFDFDSGSHLFCEVRRRPTLFRSAFCSCILYNSTRTKLKSNQRD